MDGVGEAALERPGVLQPAEIDDEVAHPVARERCAPAHQQDRAAAGHGEGDERGRDRRITAGPAQQHRRRERRAEGPGGTVRGRVARQAGGDKRRAREQRQRLRRGQRRHQAANRHPGHERALAATARPRARRRQKRTDQRRGVERGPEIAGAAHRTVGQAERAGEPQSCRQRDQPTTAGIEQRPRTGRRREQCPASEQVEQGRGERGAGADGGHLAGKAGERQQPEGESAHGPIVSPPG